MNAEDYKIVVHSQDREGEDADFKYCAIVMAYNNDWYNTGIVVRDKLPEVAFKSALLIAKERGIDF